MTPVAPLLGALVAAGSAIAVMGLLVPRLPEPARDEGPDQAWAKPPYRALATPQNLAAAGVLGAGAGALTGGQPVGSWPLLLVLAGPTAALVLVDALTTYLPLRLTQLCWLLAGLAMVAELFPAGPQRPALLIRWLVAGLVSLAIFWAVWRLGAGLGFGDVRLAPLVAVAAANDSWQAWYLALLCGTTIGALWGVTTTLWRRRHPHPLGTVFPYGPSLWLGLWPALLLT
ncbi:leader peptidase (prepilin peptidase)/N-methyltransferase [Luteococcus sp. H138]|uniref:leader peptidase (prepilin peptidase)/N-methyltransferase n=1 Tax=unclassified Luteococcus TaxID=2639923 RepID=UPI00313DCE7B